MSWQEEEDQKAQDWHDLHGYGSNSHELDYLAWCETSASGPGWQARIVRNMWNNLRWEFVREDEGAS